MEIVLCFASYEVKKGMYYNTTVDSDCFDKSSVIEEVENYYKGINVEEFLLADAWTDDNEYFNKLIRIIYTESYLEFMDELEKIIEANLTGDDLERLAVYLEANGDSILDEALENESYNDVEQVDSFKDYLAGLLIEQLPEGSYLTNIAYWLSEDQAQGFIEANEYGTCQRYKGKKYLIRR